MNGIANLQVQSANLVSEKLQIASPAGLSLALSGGGARGLAHIGILEILDERKIDIHAISGASMGGVIGALYASGMSGAELHQIANKLAQPRQLFKLVELRPGRRGLVSAAKLEELLGQFIKPATTFDDLRLPLALTATDLESGRQINLQSGSVIKAVMATCAFPGVFPPVQLNGLNLVDGGVRNNLPVDLLDQHTSPILAVDVSPNPINGGTQEPPGLIARMPAMAQILYRSTMLMNHAVTESILEDQPPDLLLQPPISSEIGVFDGFTRSEEIIQIGRQCMLAQIGELYPLMR